MKTKILLAMLALITLSGCMTMEEYRANYCNYDTAYKRGMNDAQQAQPMDSSVSMTCAPEQKVAVERGYREGYTTYLQSAPPNRVQINVGTPPGYVPVGPIESVGPVQSIAPAETDGSVSASPIAPIRRGFSECRFTADCSGNKFCRNRGDGIHLCLGGEFRGGFCEYTSDCGGGLFCRHFENNIGRCL